MNLLKRISQKSSEDTVILKENVEAASKEIISLRKQENRISMELSKYKSRYIEIRTTDPAVCKPVWHW